MIEARRRDRFLNHHSEVDEVRNDLHLNLRLDVAALEPKSSKRFAVFQNHARHEGVDTAFVRPDAGWMIFFRQKQVSAVLQDNSGFWLDDTRAEPHEITLDKRYEIAFAVYGGKVFGIGIQWHGFKFTRRSI